MGYTTEFSGELKFVNKLTEEQLFHLESFFGEDCRNHREWGDLKSLSYIDLELNEDRTGVKWNGTEKTYHMEKLVNVIIRLMRQRWPHFALTGQMTAQGEDIDDRWILKIGKDGFARKESVKSNSQSIKCPHCDERITNK